MLHRSTASIISLLLATTFAGCSNKDAPALSAHRTDKSVTVYSGNKPVLSYNLGLVEPPEGIDTIYRRSGFIHPVYTPAGNSITQSFSKNHPHQNGIFMAWTQTQFRGETVDFWNIHKGLGQVSHKQLLSIDSSKSQCSFTVELAHKERVGEMHEIVLNEILTVTVYPEKDRTFVFDVSSKQTLATEEPLILNEYRYGGMALRLTDQWFGKENQQVSFTTSEGQNRIDANQTRQRWVAASGTIDGEIASIAVLGHPDNFRAPQPVRIHDEIPYFSYSPMALGEFSIKPGDEYISRYRYIVSSEKLDTTLLNAQWERYASE